MKTYHPNTKAGLGSYTSLLLLAVVCLCSTSCYYPGRFVTRITPGPNNTLRVETAEFQHNWFFNVLTTVNHRTEQITLPQADKTAR